MSSRLNKTVIAAVCVKLILTGVFFATQAMASSAAVVGSTAIADIVEQVSPAVVNISTTQKMKSRVMMPEFNFPDMGPGSPFGQFKEFFDKMKPPPGEEGEMPGHKATSLGSGFVIDPSGYIVTNNHVIAEAEQITVKFTDNTERPAKIIGRDAKSDLALLKVEASKPLPFVSFGDSDKARVGEWVVAVGNPFGLGGTVTAGIISAKARDINAGPFDNFLQSDAAINSGNSGGPMFNMEGKVIGINTAIFSPSGGNIGIGFATPSSFAQPVIEQLKKNGKARWSWLGVKIQAVNEEVAQSLGLEKSRGALVAEVTPGSPADKAKILAGDIIMEFNGVPVDQMRSVPRLVAQTPIGQEVPVVVWRGSEKKTLKATLVESKEKDTSENVEVPASGTEALPQASGKKLLGMELATLDAATRETRKIDKAIQGALIVKIDRKSAAYARGLRPDDVLVKVNEANVMTVADLEKNIQAAKKQGRKFALLRVFRAGETHFVTLPTEEEKTEKKE